MTEPLSTAALHLAATLSVAGLASMEEEQAPKFVLVTDTALMAERASTGGVTWVDFDGDGDDDAFVTNGYDVSAETAVPQTNVLYENVNGVLEPLDNELSAASGFSSGSAWADFDNDGRIDLFVPNQMGQNNFLYRNVGGGSFQLLDKSQPASGGGLSFSATWGDIDGDGRVDLFVGNGGLSGAERDFLYRNGKDGVFALETEGPVVATATQSGGATFIDYDLDGDADLFVPGAVTRMYRNDGSGHFESDERVEFVNDPNTGGPSISGAWGDFDNDGDFDLFQVFTQGQPRRLYENEGDGTFFRREVGDATSDRSSAFYSLWVDLDNDGYLDLVVANYGAAAQVYMNRSGNTLERVAAGALSKRVWYASMVAASDHDRDGDVDLVVGNWPNAPGEGEANLLYENQGPVGNWVALRLEGSCSNRSAIGARVELDVRHGKRTRTLMRDVRSQDGWRSQSSLELLFGLGAAQSAENVRIFWPSGVIQEVGAVKAGERRTVVESCPR
jgi:hypothetical protein